MSVVRIMRGEKSVWARVNLRGPPDSHQERGAIYAA